MSPESGDTLDLKRVRLTVAQFVALFLLLSAALTGATVTTVTTQETAAAVREMRLDLKKINEALTTAASIDARHGAEIDALKDDVKQHSARDDRRRPNRNE